MDDHSVDLDALRSLIGEKVGEYADAALPTTFEAGKTFIPASGKVLDSADIQNAVDAALDAWLTSGRFCEAFEARLAEWIGVREVLMTVSGSAANLLAFSALTSWKLKNRIRPGDEVITVAAGFPTTVAPIIQNNCVPVFVDIDPATLNVNVDRLAEAVGPKTRAIMIAHTLGNPFDLDAVMSIATEHDLFVIEDCCDALGATYNGQHVGTFGDFGTLSFYPAHHITTGEGGAVFTRRKFLSRQAESFRDWGRDCWCAPGMADTCGKRFEWNFEQLPDGYDHKYVYSHIGYNLKVTDMQAAVGLSQLDKAASFISKRRANYKFFRDAIMSEGLDEHFIVATETKKSSPSWFGLPLTIRGQSPLKRLDVTRYLEGRKIGTRLLFAGNVTRQPGFREAHYRVEGPLDVTDMVMNRTFWIGVWPGIGDQEREYIVSVLQDLKKDLIG